MIDRLVRSTIAKHQNITARECAELIGYSCNWTRFVLARLTVMGAIIRDESKKPFRYMTKEFAQSNGG